MEVPQHVVQNTYIIIKISNKRIEEHKPIQIDIATKRLSTGNDFDNDDDIENQSGNTKLEKKR